MVDAFGKEINIKDKVIGIANLSTTQTFYFGEILSFVGNCVEVKITESANILNDNEPYSSGNDRRICLSHRLVKI